MGFSYLTNVPLETARRDYLDVLKENRLSPARETVAVADACGRVTAEAVYARICAPHYAASAMDGVALLASLTFGASETTPVALAPGQFTVVDTGDPVPDGCDAVIMIEDVVIDSDSTVTLHEAAAPWQHIRQIGEDICAGDMILGARMPVTPAAIGALIAGGVTEIPVVKRPVVGIIPTGDELVPPTSDPRAGDILEFNSAIFSAMLGQWGAVARTYPIVKDDPALLKAAVLAALDACDVVLLNAGSSAGREDHAAAVIGAVGTVLYHGIAMRPGKPAILGYRGGQPILGVPGYPVSGMLVLEELLKPILSYCNGMDMPAETALDATLARPVMSGLKYEEFVRVSLGLVDGKAVASPLSRGSGVVSSFMKADGILAVPQGVEGYEAGQTVRIRLLGDAAALPRTLVAIGSHDPLLDEAADLLHLTDPTMRMRSTHVGSMGGIMAVRRREAHVAGVHLLSEADGTYNTAYIEKYFPDGGVRLLACVGRTQGLMTTAGNPLGMQGVADLTRPGLRYVNRQKGSGTRILIDYLCRRAGIDAARIYGYEREEFTHTAVAAQIAAGSADAGLGILAAAKLYGLGFLPVCTEQYDLLIPDYAWDTPLVRQLVAVLQSDAFRDRLSAMGGYTLDCPGQVRRRF